MAYENVAFSFFVRVVGEKSQCQLGTIPFLVTQCANKPRVQNASDSLLARYLEVRIRQLTS